MKTINSVAKYGERKRGNTILNVINHPKVLIIVDVFENLDWKLKMSFSAVNKSDFDINLFFG